MTKSTVIQAVHAFDMRFDMEEGAGADGVHSNPQYSYAVAYLKTDGDLAGVGLAFTLGAGNDLVCQAIQFLGELIAGYEIEALMTDFNRVYTQMADHPQFRWLGPHKGVVHLALAALVNACFDLWAKSREVPLWKLLLDLEPEALVKTLDFRYLEEVLSPAEAVEMLRTHQNSRRDREGVLEAGYPGYDTSVGWFNYSDDTIRENAIRAMGEGFGAVKLKVGSVDIERDVRRATLIRETIGSDTRFMIDCNQQWTLPQAVRAVIAMQPLDLYWVEEPTHPDDVLGHQALARAIAPIGVALGEHVPNKLMFKNFLQAGAVHFNQVDVVRVGGVSEFLLISMLSRKFNVPVVPHVGDMGQIHQHLVLFNHIALGHEVIFLEYIPHLRPYFTHPAQVEGGVYHTPQVPGSSSDLNTLPADI